MKPNDKRSAGIHVGSASIIMIFAVLCLTVFSTLSYVTANQEYRLAQKSALAMEQYYAADWQCEVYYEQIYDLLKGGIAAKDLPQYLDVEVTETGTAAFIDYAVDIDAEIQKDKGTEMWAVAAKAPHAYSDEIAVWDGE